jgi:hypothetical protein
MKTTTMIHQSETKPTNAVRSRLAMLIVTLALTTTSVTSYGAAIAHWTFDESGGTVANDSVGTFNGNLSATGSAFVSGGISGNAISLERAANGFVNMGNVLGLTSGSFSLVAWVKMNSTEADTVALGKHQTFSHNGYFLAINPTGGGGQVNKAMFYQGSIVGAPVSTTSVNDGNWHQIVAVYQAGGSKSVYVDGSPAENIKASQSFIGNSAPFLIGGTGIVPEGRYSGLIDDVQIYSHALSDNDVNFLFNNPGQVVLECSVQLAAVQSQLAAANATNAALQAQLVVANQNIQDLQNENIGLLLPLHVLTEEYRVTFKDPSFQIRGGTSVEQMQNFVSEVLDLPRGQQQNLFIKLGGQR